MSSQSESIGKPGTPITLEGIIWQESLDGILVVKVIWRNKTYVGTLIQCSSHLIPIRFCDSATEELDSRTLENMSSQSESIDKPGAPITLEGIIWQESLDGILVVKVIWRNKTYVGTLIQCSSHLIPIRFCDSATEELDSRTPKRRRERGRNTNHTPELRNCTQMQTSEDHTPSLVKPVTDLNTQISTKEYKTTSPPCALSPVVLLERLEQVCNKKYKTANGLRYYLETPSSQQTTSSESSPNPISPIRTSIQKSSSVVNATVNNNSSGGLLATVKTLTPTVITQIIPPHSPLLTQQTQAVQHSMPRGSIIQENNHILPESQSSLLQQSESITNESIGTSLEVMFDESPVTFETFFNDLLSDSPTNTINNKNNISSREVLGTVRTSTPTITTPQSLLIPQQPQAVQHPMPIGSLIDNNQSMAGESPVSVETLFKILLDSPTNSTNNNNNSNNCNINAVNSTSQHYSFNENDDANDNDNIGGSITSTTNNISNSIEQVTKRQRSDSRESRSHRNRNDKNKANSEDSSSRDENDEILKYERKKGNEKRDSNEKSKSQVKTILTTNQKISSVNDDQTLLQHSPPSSAGTPPRNISSNILYITNLCLPFVSTLVQIKDLLGKTGKIVEKGFSMDRIKSECYVKYETEDQAIKTKHKLHGVRWPTSNLKCLNVDFGTEEAMQNALNCCEKVRNKPFECDLCESKFTAKSSLKTHKYLHTGEKPFECDVCESKFARKSSLENHKRAHTGEKPFECDICERKFTLKCNLKQHRKKHKGEKPFECDLCESKFARKSSLENHKRAHTGEKPFECDLCERKFAQKSYLEIHKSTHTGEKPFECDVCESKFARKSYLEIHKRTHTSEKPFECDLCESKFARKSSLENHKRAHTGEKPFECDLCERKFAQKSYLEIHKSTHTGEKPFECDICEGKFAQKSGLEIHKRAHTGEKPFECDLCERKFAQKSYLEIHKRTHTGEKPFECDLCERKFAQKSYLEIHKRTHTGEKPFECDLCESKFARKSSLENHKSTHTGEKLFECDICERKFAQKRSLKRHKYLHTGEKPFQCDICERKFARKWDFEQHKKKHKE